MQTIGGRLTSTRGGAILVGLVAAIIAAVLLIVYVTHYRTSVKSDAAPLQVLVAKKLIPAGTTGAEIGRKQLYSLTTVPKDQVQTGALADPNGLTGQAAATDIFPGAQLTTTNVTAAATSDAGGTTGGLTSQLKANQRAVAIQIDALAGNLGNLQPGDHVDIYQEVKSSGVTIIKLFRSNVPVLQVAGSSADATTGAISSGQIVLGVPARDSADLLYASRHTTLSFALRPAKGATPTPAETANNQTMLQYSRSH